MLIAITGDGTVHGEENDCKNTIGSDGFEVEQDSKDGDASKSGAGGGLTACPFENTQALEDVAIEFKSDPDEAQFRLLGQSSPLAFNAQPSRSPKFPPMDDGPAMESAPDEPADVPRTQLPLTISPLELKMSLWSKQAGLSQKHWESLLEIFNSTEDLSPLRCLPKEKLRRPYDRS